jgi:hypothetical protein
MARVEIANAGEGVGKFRDALDNAPGVLRDRWALHTDLCVDRGRWDGVVVVGRLISKLKGFAREYSIVGRLGFRFFHIT